MLSQRPKTIALSDAETISRLRLLICRAAQTDSLNWWEDHSFVPEGLFIAERLFGNRPRNAAVKIALTSARSRHWAAIPKTVGVVHLFDFGDEIEYELSRVPLQENWIPSAAFASIDDLLIAIKALVPERAGYGQAKLGENGTVVIAPLVDAEKGAGTILLHASALALAYQLAKAGQPMFPYTREAH